jgi:uncharacterized protein
MTKIPGIEALYANRILSLFQLLPPGTEVILFGSRAKGNFREGSDIDIAIKSKNLSQADIEVLRNQYENLFLPWKLDLVLYSSIEEPALREHIDRIGKQLRGIGSPV